jgi:hypothetical protein
MGIGCAMRSVCEPGSSVSIVSGYGMDDRGSTPGRSERSFPLASVSRSALGPTQPPVQWVPGVLSPGLKRGRGVTLTTHSYLVPWSRMSRSYIFSSPKCLYGVWWGSFSFNFVFERSRIQITTRRPAILTEVFRGVPQSLQANARIVP